MDRIEISRLSREYDIRKDLLRELLDSYGSEETKKIISMNKSDLISTARVNLLKLPVDKLLENIKREKITASPLKEIQEAIQIHSGMRYLGSSLSYLAGEVMPQGLGSMLTVEALAPKPGNYILDMTAAPGGKSCFIGERMNNLGLLVCNDQSRSRSKSLISNLSRHGILNSIVTQYDGLNFPDFQFDKILLDAPCSGSGLIVSNRQRRINKSVQNSYQLQRVQISLLRKVIDLLKPGGEAVYSTCSLSIVENEEVLSKFLDEISLLKTPILGDPGSSDIDSEFLKAKRLLPSKHKSDGFFIAKFRKNI